MGNKSNDAVAEVKRQEWVIKLWRDVHTPHHDIEQHLEEIDPEWRDRWGADWETAAEHYAQQIVEAALGEK